MFPNQNEKIKYIFSLKESASGVRLYFNKESLPRMIYLRVLGCLPLLKWGYVASSGFYVVFENSN